MKTNITIEQGVVHDVPEDLRQVFCLTLNCWKNGTNSRRLLATNGFAGQRWSNKRKPEKSISNDCKKKS